MAKVIIPIFIALLIVACSPEQQSTYYFDPVQGNNENSGTSPDEAFKTLDMISKLSLKAGDQLLLAAGQTFSEPLILINIKGAAGAPITVTTYGDGESSTINMQGNANGIVIENSAFLEISNIRIFSEQPAADTLQANMRCGALVIASEPGTYQHIYLKRIDISDIFYEAEGFRRGEDEVRTANGTQKYGWGIRVIDQTKGAVLEDIRIESCSVKNVSHTGIKLTGNRESEVPTIRKVVLSNNQVIRTGGPGIQMSLVSEVHAFGNQVDRSGSDDDSRKWGRGSGLWTWGSDHVLIEGNRFTNANGPGDSAGAHIDFNCSDVVLQYNFSANNAGGFCEILGNNFNCAYRYNISYNDGHRVKGENGAFQEGKVFWLSGYQGNKKPRNGPFNSYFYNNTIVVQDSIQAKMAIDAKAKGILIANNIFHIEKNAIPVKGDQYKPENSDSYKNEKVVFENNLFLKPGSWPSEMPLQDQRPIFGDANLKVNWLDVQSFIPGNKDLIVDQGIEIQTLHGDSIGLFTGLKVARDFFGNPITGKPDLGAIEIQ